jgi:hypothetical protein
MIGSKYPVSGDKLKRRPGRPKKSTDVTIGCDRELGNLVQAVDNYASKSRDERFRNWYVERAVLCIQQARNRGLVENEEWGALNRITPRMNSPELLAKVLHAVAKRYAGTPAFEVLDE